MIDTYRGILYLPPHTLPRYVLGRHGSTKYCLNRNERGKGHTQGHHSVFFLSKNR